MDYSNIPTGLKINSQIPLDVKGYALNEATLAYLGLDNNLAFTYHEGLRVVCIEERKVYEWREVGVGEENTGLVAVDFTYPSNLADVYGINYSDRVFNFFLVNQITPETLEDYVLQIDLPDFECKNIVLNTPSVGAFSIFDGEEIIGNLTKFKLKGIGTGAGFSETGITITEVTSGSNKTLFFSLTPYFNQTPYTSISGNMSYITPLKIDILNPQKTISSFPYELNYTDDQHTLFITNGPSNVEIRVPDTLSDNFTCVIIQEGIGTVTVTALGATVLNIPVGLTSVIKGQYHWAMLEKKGATTSHYLGGSLTPIP